MDKQMLDFVVKKTHEMTEAFSCSGEAKQAAQSWLDAVGTDREAAETQKYISVLEGCLMPIDMLIAFAGSEQGRQVFGEEGAKNALAHSKQIKAEGAAYCDCPACVAVAEILAKKNDILK